MSKILEELYALKDERYAEFQAKLTPTVDKNLFIGVRVPVLRQLAKKYSNTDVAKEFFRDLPHKYYDENMLDVLLVSQVKDFDLALKETERILPYVDNWATCDILSPKVFAKNKEKLLPHVLGWINSQKEYTVRFGIEMLMSFYLDKDFKAEYNEVVSKVVSDKYYVNMMCAWYFATALTKQWDKTIGIMESKVLPVWVHNKTIQKAIESYRITDEQKNYLRSLKIKAMQ